MASHRRFVLSHCCVEELAHRLVSGQKQIRIGYLGNNMIASESEKQ